MGENDDALIIKQGRDDFLANMLLSEGIGDDIRYDHLHGHWLTWNGVRWRPDRTRRVYDLIRQYADRVWTSSSESDGDTRKMLLTLFDTGRKESVLKSLMAREGIAMTGEEWDTDPFLLGFENGILDLRTREFDAHPSPNTYVSKSVGYDWDPDADCPTFKDFVLDIMGGDTDLAAYLLTMLGYSLFGLQSEQKFWMWVGRGSNGKGILARTVHRTLGDYSDTPSDTLYMKTRAGAAPSSAARPDLTRLQAVRFTYMSEPQGGQFNEEMLKAHTGEDVILARDLYKGRDQFARFAPTHKIVFLTNDPPKTDDVGVSMRRRARVIQFEQDYSGERADMTIEDRIGREKPGIMAFLTQWALGWWNDGDPGLKEPAQVTAWSEAYIEENDPLAKFIEDRCVLGRTERGAAHALWSAYEDWCAVTNTEPKSQTGFGLAMGRRFVKTRTKTGFIYTGIRALRADELADRDG